MALITPATLNSISILVAEDDVILRFSAVRMLSDEGFFAIEAEHAAEAISILQSRAEDVHVLFSDVHMPGEMSGIDLAHHVSAHWPWIGLLITSGVAVPLQSHLPDGAHFLPKPYLPEDVISRVRHLAGNIL